MDSNGTSMYMPVAPANYGGGFGDFGGNGWWIILLFLFAGGFGNGFGGFGGNTGAGFVGADVQRGFDQSAMMGGISGLQSSVTSGFGDLQNGLCNGFAGVNSNIANGFAQSEIAANGRQMADMNQNFGMQTSILQGFNGLQSQLSQCCCDNRMATVQTQNIVQTEAAATRLAIEKQTQAILDKLCAQEIETLRTANVNLQNQLNMANLAASQTAQTQQIIAALTPAA